MLQDNVNLAAFFAWSLLDNFEWTQGYGARYGIVHVDRASEGLERTPKLSAQWLSQHFFRCAGCGRPALAPSCLADLCACFCASTHHMT